MADRLARPGIAGPRSIRALFPPIERSRLRFRGGIAAVLPFLVLVLLYPMSLQQADWVATKDQFTYIAVIAVVLGTLLGNARMRLRNAFTLGAGLGALVVLLLTIFADGSGGLRERSIDLATNVNNWLTQALAGEAASDPTAFVLLLGATVWATSFFGAFALAREHRIWDAIILCGSCLLVNVSVALTTLFVDLIVFTLAALFLLTRLHVVALQDRWQKQNIQPAGEMDWRVLRGGLTWTLVLVLMAFFTPRVGAADVLSSALTTFEAPYHSMEAEWQRFFAGVSGPSRLRGVSFTDAIRLGQAPNLGDRIVMTVDAPAGHFWRAVTYDFYTGAGWKTTETDKAEKVAVRPQGREKVDMTFDVFVPHGDLVFSANEANSVNMPVRYQTGEDRTYSTSIRAVNRHQATGPYAVTTFVSTADKATLRKAATNYSAYIKAKYLQLPSSLPQRVKDKARQVAGDRLTAYDKAETIENWLRTTYRYSTVVKTPPAGRDPVDYFLFDLKEDFCEYFASSMVVMLRELGVPARLVEGFTTGTFDAATGKYHVREQNAHAWVEVYFSNYGWVEFEPTPSETVFPRIDDETAIGGGGTSTDVDPSDGLTDEEREREGLLRDMDADGGDFLSGPADAVRNVDPRPALIALLLVLIAAIVAFIRFEWRFRGLPAIDSAWGKTRLLGAYVGHVARPSQTAYEYAKSLGAAVPEIADPARTLAHVRVLERYTPVGASDDDRVQAVAAWRRIARALVQMLPRRISHWISLLFR